MKTIRCGSFETNSSSTHAIVVPKSVDKNQYDLYDSLYHNYYFSREESRLVEDWDEKLAYVYYVLINYRDYKKENSRYSITPKEIDDFKNLVNEVFVEVCKELKLSSDVGVRPNDIFYYIDTDGESELDDNIVFLEKKPSPYVDHIEDFEDNDFLERLLNDKDFLKRFLFNKGSYITVCGDEYRGYNIKTIGFQYDYDEYFVNNKNERPPKEWFKSDGRVKKKYIDKFCEEYKKTYGDFWKKLEDYEETNDVYLKGN